MKPKPILKYFLLDFMVFRSNHTPHHTYYPIKTAGLLNSDILEKDLKDIIQEPCRIIIHHKTPITAEQYNDYMQNLSKIFTYPPK